MKLTPKGYAIGEKIAFIGNNLLEIKRNLFVETQNTYWLDIVAASYTVDIAGNYIDLYVSFTLPRYHRGVTISQFNWIKVTGIRTKHLPHLHRS